MMQELVGCNLTRTMASFLLFLSCFVSGLYWVDCVTQAEVLSHLHAAVDADPSNYMSYYKRATVYLAMSRSRPALSDLDTVLKRKPDFLKARHQRGGVLLKMGRLDEAHIDLENVVRKEPNNEEAQKQYAMVNTLKERVEEIRDYINWDNYEPAIEILNEVLEFIPWDHTLWELRAEAYLGLGNVIYAISDIRTVTKLTSDNTAAFFKLANLHYQIGEADESLSEIRECLKLDPEHKDCYPLYKKLKKVAKFLTQAKDSREQQDWEECVNSAQKVLKNEPSVEGIRFHGYDRLVSVLYKNIGFLTLLIFLQTLSLPKGSRPSS